MDGQDVTLLKPYRRNIGYVPQRISLFPHMNVNDNIAFGLKVRRYPNAKIGEEVDKVLDLVHMQEYRYRQPSKLSGGQAQRIAIARALVTNPQVLLMDEPLSSLDAKLRAELKFEIRDIQRKTKKIVLYVTHDQSEAFSISDVVYLMESGKIVQYGSPTELYSKPQSRFVAEFISNNNLFEAKVLEYSGQQLTVKAGTHEFVVPWTGSPQDDLRNPSHVIICIRPEDLTVEEHASHQPNLIQGVIKSVDFTGTLLFLNVNSDLGQILVSVTGARRWDFINKEGKDVALSFRNASVIVD